MSDELDVIVIDDDPSVCEVISELIRSFYSWGDVISFTDVDKAISYCLSREVGVGIFVIDVFLGGKSGFCFLDSIKAKFPAAAEDSILITGSASDDVVNMCISSDVTYLLEKPIKPYALQLAIRSIVTKYLTFARRLLRDPAFAANVSKF
jgi:CheY-like chemotaxis protein